MLKGMIRWSLQYRILIVILAVALMAFGIYQVRNMPVDVLPEFSPPYVEIQTEALGLSAQEVEQLVTLGLEQDLLNGVPWLQTIRSESVPGLSSITLIFEPGTDVIRARQIVSERLAQAFALPHVSKPPTMLQPLSSSSRVLIVGLSSKELSLIQLGVLARWTIAPRLMGVPGVANVAIWGQRDRQLQVQVDPQKLQDKKVSLLQVLETTGNALWVSSLSFVEASTPGTGGFIDTANQRLGIRHILPIVSPDNLAKVPIEDSTAKLGEVANVVEDHQPLIGDALDQNQPGLLLVVEKFPNTNTLEVTRGIEDALAEMQPGMKSVNMNSDIFRPAAFIDSATNNLSIALLIGFALVALTLALFFFQWRSVVICLIVIPLSLALGGLVLSLRGATMNMMVVAGFAIALSVLIDDVVVDVDNITRRLRQPREVGNMQSAANVILEAAGQTRSVMFYALLILALAILPVFFIGGVAGSFFQPLAVSYLLALLASMLAALVVTPALCMILFARSMPSLVDRAPSPISRALQSIHAKTLGAIVERGGLGLAAAAVLLVIGLGALPFLQPALQPAFKERNLRVLLSGAPGISQPEMSRISGLMGSELQKIPGVRNVSALVGRAIYGDRVVNVSSSDLWVSLDDAVDYDKTASAIKKVVNGYPGIKGKTETYLQDASGQVFAKPEDGLVVRLYGDNAGVLSSQAEAVKQAIAGAGGVTDVKINTPVQQPSIEIEVDMAAAQKYGIKPGDVRRAAATILSGIQVGNLFEEQKVFDVVVWSTPATRSSMNSINDLQIDTPDGGHVRLGDVAKVKIVPAESIVRHEAVRRYIDIVASVKGSNLSAVAGDINNRLKQIQFPLEYHAEILGDYATQQATQTRLIVMAIVSALGAFFLLQALYGSWRLALLTVVTMPAALAGGLVAVLLTGGGLTLGALAGLLATFGIAVRGQMALITHYRHLIKNEDMAFGRELVLRGARDRLIPTLTTAVAATLMLLPALFMGSIPGLEILRPMAIVLLGGLLTATLLNVLIAPMLFLWLRVTTVQEIVLTAPEPVDVTPSMGETAASA